MAFIKGQSRNIRKHPIQTWVFIILGICITSCLIFLSDERQSATQAGNVSAGVCGPFRRLMNSMQPPAFKNPRFKTVRGPSSILIKNSTVWDGLGNVLEHANLLLIKGIIANMSTDCIDYEADRTIDANGRIVTPGIVDMHSHMGVDSWPTLRGNDDTNEMTSPDNSQVRVIDAFNPLDPAIRLIMSGGVTTSLVLPGSGNVMGGEAHVFKHRPLKSVEKMSILYGESPRLNDNRIRWMKMAFGENPKRVYGSVDKLPQTRMGVAWVLRKKLSKAKRLMHEQDDWCQNYHSASAVHHVTSIPAFPADLELESLVALLRGQVHLHTHVYMIQDIESLLRISHEFNFTISALHHATSAHLLAETLAEERRDNSSLNANLIAALFADKGFYKAEAYYASTHAHRVLQERGVPFAIKSDHPVTNAQFLAFEASKLVHFGHDPQNALRAITSTPAASLGIADRVGSIRIGMDADVVLWDGHLFEEITCRPNTVIIDGEVVFEKQKPDPMTVATKQPSKRPSPKQDVCRQIATNGKRTVIHLRNVTGIHINSTTYLTDIENRLEVIFETGKVVSSSIRVHDELTDDTVQLNKFRIKCIGYAPECENQLMNADSVVKIQLPGQVHILPSPMAAHSGIGLREISQESVTSAGSFVVDPWDPIALDGGLSVADQVSASLGSGLIEDGGYSKLFENWIRSGGHMALAVPPGKDVIMGTSALLKRASYATESSIESSPFAVVKTDVAIHIQLGQRVQSASPSLDSFSGQMEYLRHVFKRAADQWIDGLSHQSNIHSKNHFVDVLRGLTPLALHSDTAEHILQFLKLKFEIEAYLENQMRGMSQDLPAKIHLLIIGGAESWLIAKELASANVKGVILSSVNCIPSEYESKRCQSMSSLMHPVLGVSNRLKLEWSSGVRHLLLHGISLAVASDDDNFLPDVYNNAAWVKFMSNRDVDGSIVSEEDSMSIHDSVGLLSWNLAQMFKLTSFSYTSDLRDQQSDMVVFSGGHPLETLHSNIAMSIQHVGIRTIDGNLLAQNSTVEVRCNPQLL